VQRIEIEVVEPVPLVPAVTVVIVEQSEIAVPEAGMIAEFVARIVQVVELVNHHTFAVACFEFCQKVVVVEAVQIESTVFVIWDNLFAQENSPA
jgi:hypothetical protein